MNYLQKQVLEKVEINEVMEYLIEFFSENQNKKIQLPQIVGNKYSYEEIDRELTKLVSRNIINEFYITDKHFFEYTTCNEISSSDLCQEIIGDLKIKGYRITDSRKKLIKIFTSSPNRHFTFDELVQLNGPKVNIATMYNNIATLLEERKINELFLDETKLFELNIKSHAHFICETCKVVFNVDTKSSELLNKEVEDKYLFKVHNKRLEYTGVCNNCSIIATSENIVINNENMYPKINNQEILDYFKYLQSKTNNNDKEITVVFLSVEEIQQLNNEFRGIDTPTDVLSFVDDEDDNYLGDILICYDYIQKQATEYEHSFKRELLFLITHGYLHLIGYDHIEPEDEKEMFALQNELLNKYGVSRNEQSWWTKLFKNNC